jgi:uncharacterized protein
VPAAEPLLPPRLSVALRDYAERLRAGLGSRLCGVKLFGSWARGQAGPTSDVDVWVLVDTLDVVTRNRPFEAAHQTLVEHGLDLTPTVMDQAEWQLLLGRERRIALDIEREGLPI